MKSLLRTLSLCGVLAAAAPCLFGQTAPAQPATAVEGETVSLDPFLVKGDFNQGYFSKSAAAAGRIVQNLEDVPQRIDIFNSKFIKDIGALSFQDVLSFSSAVQFSNTERNSSGGFVRGFDYNQPLRNGTTAGGYYIAPSASMETVEQIEVVKGAAAVLYGASQPGGVINYVTKAPQFVKSNSATLRLHSFGGYTASIDSTGPLGLKDSNGHDTLAYRVVLTQEDRKGYQINDDYTKRMLLYGRMTWKPVSGLVVDLELEKSRIKSAFPNSIALEKSQFNTASANGSTTIPYRSVRLPYALEPVDFTIQDNGNYRQDHTAFGQLSTVYSRDFGRFGQWTARAFYSLTEYSAERVLMSYASTQLPAPVVQADLGKVVNYNQTVSQADINSGRFWVSGRHLFAIFDRPIQYGRYQYDLTGKFTTGPLKHTFLVGTDGDLGLNTKIPNDGSAVTQNKRVDSTGTLPAKHAFWVDSPVPGYNFSGEIDWSNTSALTQNVSNGLNYTKSLKFKVPFLTSPVNNYYFFDAIGLLDDKLNLSLGARYDSLTATSGTATFSAEQWTYRYGAVYKALPFLHVYALHNESFLPNSQAAINDLGKYVPPQNGKHEELGVRLMLFKNRLTIDGSIYQIQNINLVQLDPFLNNTGNPADKWKLIPGQKNRGYDLDLKLNLTCDTQVMVSYAHYNMVNYGNPTQVAAGLMQFPTNNVAPDQFSIWGKWTPRQDMLNGFDFSLGYRATSARPGGSVGNVPLYELNSYGITDLGVGYHWKKWDFSILVKNAFDKYAYRVGTTTTLYPERPREASFTASIKF